MKKHSHIVAINSARQLLRNYRSLLEEEVEWAWRAHADSFAHGSHETPESREKLESRLRQAEAALGELLGTLKELERVTHTLCLKEEQA